MAGIVIFNVVMIALGVAVGAGWVPGVSSALYWLHSIIGITPPAPDKARIFALVWIGAMILIVDGLLLLLVFLTTRTM